MSTLVAVKLGRTRKIFKFKTKLVAQKFIFGLVLMFPKSEWAIQVHGKKKLKNK
jgi:hypothetical protein